ncbi:MAG: ADP-forming succinate--CoA ligase subunit beta [Chlorobi bacterium]|nr:MAG: succinyl-CoA synthetase, beta subunit [Chlorobi bacterium OLB7]MBK8912040.1 ADP-forming succinate--CoA ligase subunit beta [Chlorobiota bacterium]MBX7215323.1 ADP-forming succinate--CoA ligase subunit beta [Candidatus Kapabacteria bacterium]
MNLHEHQAKELLGKYGVPVQTGRVSYSPEQAVENAYYALQDGAELLILKAQIHAGGRGKGVIHNPETNEPVMYNLKELRGVKVLPATEGNPLHEVYEISRRMLGQKLVTLQTGPQGKIINRMLVANGVDIAKEFYCSILMDRGTGKNIIMVSTEGGVEIEKVAEETPEKIIKEYIEPGQGVQGFQARRLAFGLGLNGAAQKQFISFITALYNAYLSIDASMVEVNPMVLTPDDKIIAVDAKVSIDDNALYRHKDIAAMRDESEEDPLEVEAGKYDLNYIKLDGNVGCMVNGAGLAMATMDIIKLAGGEPANFLDVGGGASVDRVANAFRVMMSDPNVKAVLINIFGGIVRCDRVANGIIQAMETVAVNVPVIVRLDGTNAEEARQILLNSPLNFSVAGTLLEAAQKVTEALEAAAATTTVGIKEGSTVMSAAMASASVIRRLDDDDDMDFSDDDNNEEEEEDSYTRSMEEVDVEEIEDPDAMNFADFDEEELDDDVDNIDSLFGDDDDDI